MNKIQLITEALEKIGITSANIKFEGSIAKVQTTNKENFELFIFERKRQHISDPYFSISEDGVRMMRDCDCELFANLYGNVACTITDVHTYYTDTRDEMNNRVLTFINPLHDAQA